MRRSCSDLSRVLGSRELPEQGCRSGQWEVTAVSWRRTLRRVDVAGGGGVMRWRG